MVAGHLREKNGYYHMVLNYVDEYGKRHTPSKSTGLTVKGNKKRAEKMLSEARAAKEAELEARAIERSTGKAPVGTILFTAFLLDWLDMTKKNVEETTYGAYSMTIKSKIIPYFEEHHPGLALCEVTPKHIQDYYTYELTVRGVSANTVIHRHANIRKALQHAFKLGLIDTNPADRIERPKKEKFVGSVYEEDELNRLFEIVKGDPIELGVILGAFYGLRRSEAVGLKWDAIDFKKKTITIPPRWRIHKAETIPFYDAVITFGAKVDKKSFKGDEEIVIANYKHLVKGVSLQFAGRTNGYCFARLIQAYMTEDDLSNHPEFETFKQIQKEIRINKLRKKTEK